ncbi:MAG TPA: hypothetical protein VMV89_13480 [Candidatus Paceibacterota bacterium]|nr:hypothetical protein [Candidatus Paceibacterota bacterium]
MTATDSHSKNRFRAAAVRRLAAAGALIYTLVQFFPGATVSAPTIDGSWTQTLHIAFEQRWQFGRDIVFTYGPWGFLSGGYYPPTFVTSVIVWAMLAVVFWWAGWRMACHFSGNKLVSWLWLAGFTGMANLCFGQSFDIRCVAWVVLLLCLHFFVEDRPITARQALLTAALGLLSLVEFTSLIEAVIVVGVIAADNVFRQRRFPWIAPLFAVSLLYFWIAAGQRLSLFWPFLLNSRQLTGGFTEAMQYGITETLFVICFLSASGMIVALTGYAAWRRHGRFGVFPVAGIGAVMFLTFKHGYVRSDSGHETTAALSLLVAALACLAVSWPILQREKKWSRQATLPLVASVLFFSSFTFTGWFPEDGLLAQFVGTFSVRIILAPVKSLADTARLQKIYGQNLAAIRKQFPVPAVEGDADIYPWNQMALFAGGLNYHPRPVFQSYSAYTPELAELNAAYLRSGHAASNIVFGIDPLNGRYPSLDDGLSWPELLTRYDIADTNGTFLLLKRAAAPREYHLTLLEETTIHFGESFTLPATTNTVLWAEMDINKSMTGTVADALYKPAILRLMVSLRDRRQIYFRLVPGEARGGFILSPLIGDKASFVSLASTDGWSKLSGLEVTAITISAGTKSGSTLCYEAPVKLRLFRLDYPRQDLTKTESHLNK